jgi:uncharacterized membrane protein YeiH
MTTEPALFENFITTLEWLATMAFALSGVLAAARKRMDAVGVCMVAGIAAFGGGTLRDVLLDVRPFFWVKHSSWLWGVFVGVLVAMIFLRKRHLPLTEKSILIPDAVGLGLFTTVGVLTAYQQGMPLMVCVLMGVLTSAFGGVLRDIVCNDVPSAFADHQPYVVWSFVGGWLLLGLLKLDIEPWVAILVSALVTTGLRLVGVKFGWTLPAWDLR